ncbi:MAG: hypothetical protein Q9186_000646 [Xanthomendoza sp. 1 TL-2023]
MPATPGLLLRQTTRDKGVTKRLSNKNDTDDDLSRTTLASWSSQIQIIISPFLQLQALDRPLCTACHPSPRKATTLRGLHRHENRPARARQENVPASRAHTRLSLPTGPFSGLKRIQRKAILAHLAPLLPVQARYLLRPIADLAPIIPTRFVILPTDKQSRRGADHSPTLSPQHPCTTESSLGRIDATTIG